MEPEMLRLGGRRAAPGQLLAAADAFREVASVTRCASCGRSANSFPVPPSVRELVGLAHYRLGNYAAAANELDAYVELSIRWIRIPSSWTATGVSPVAQGRGVVVSSRRRRRRPSS